MIARIHSSPDAFKTEIRSAGIGCRIENKEFLISTQLSHSAQPAAFSNPSYETVHASSLVNVTLEDLLQFNMEKDPWTGLK